MVASQGKTLFYSLGWTLSQLGHKLPLAKYSQLGASQLEPERRMRNLFNLWNCLEVAFLNNWYVHENITALRNVPGNFVHIIAH